jgi:hypothetical protein
MSADSKDQPRNRILAARPAGEYERLLSHLKPVTLEYKQSLYEPRKTCTISTTITMGGGQNVEADAIGNREVVGINAFMGAARPHRPSSSYRYPATR